MKNKVFVIKNLKIKLLFICLIILSLFLLFKNLNLAANEEINNIRNNILMNAVRKEDVQKQRINIPEEINGYKVIGKLEIPKIELETYILSETTEKSLDVSVTKLCGPEINNIGNFCITGHNYNKPSMFGKLKKLENGDTIILTDQYGYSLQYCVNKITKVKPKDVDCLSQNTRW